ncbi:hypothetical protein ACU8NH_07995 [Rhizobium leguminosarum]|jgi:hypothetical protein|uniref:Uncharacterized protein n=1 Tax=Rhizobium leguminosarum bv. trifolii TaxID=386 RepID=A0A1B8RAN1_RHILT|nr:hypothetical protein [Rhizobium leguminosarum]AOO91389.1 hypothetical protein [Rhizobium leguminosarum bv. trifolii]MBA8836624.1 L-cysteine desulfidase [Rhizobium leguminosarum]MBP2487062.1 L-cysteine desulfidase [Rhizobium leguminosarum]MBY5913564.1 hypothetical protein [Rhizobium leguminosarum]MDH6276674.1 L-cysteine desulfidase [Rhizobium leguminosarum]
MSRLTEPSAEIDPLQRSHLSTLAADPSHPMLSGLTAIAPRLAAAMAFAWLVQMTFNLISR